MNSSDFDKMDIADSVGCAILIYSRDRAFLDYYRAMFLSLGLAPVTATTSEAALAILRLVIVAYVVLDEEAGHEGCRQVMHRACRTQRHAPVVVVSRKPDPDFQSQAMTMGAADYLNHPAFPDDFVHVLLPDRQRQERTVH